MALAGLAVSATPAAAIINGTTAGSTSWPWAVQVILVESGSVTGFCGGTLVEPTRVVTAGSCAPPSADLFVIANRKKLFDESGLIEVVDAQRAPEWSPFSGNDVAVLTLADPPVPAIPIELLGPEESGEFPDPSAALVAGWGSTDASDTDPSETLQQGEVTLQSGCEGAGTRCSSSAVKPCFGDIGGPVVVQLGTDTVSKDPSPENGSWRLVALPLGGPSDCSATVYVDLTQPSIRAFIEGTEGEQPGTGGNPAPAPSPLPASLPAAPQTKLTKTRIDAEKGKATFRFKGAGQTTGFQCALVAGKGRKPKFRACRSPKTYGNLAPGSYAFKVRAVGPGGPDATPASRRFTIRP